MLSARHRRLLSLAMPVVGGMLSQNVLNVADAAIVGGLGDIALAAVGSASVLHLATCSLLLGLGVGVQTLVARARSRRAEVGTLLLGVGLSVVLGGPLCLLALWLGPLLLRALVGDPIAGQAVPYLVARCAVLPLVVVNGCFRGFWTGTRRPACYAATLLVVHGLNLVLDVLLVHGHLGLPAMGAVGAGIASAIATAAGVVLHVVLLLVRDGLGCGRLPWSRVPVLLRLGLPSGLTQALGFGAAVGLQAAVAPLGTRELAALSVVLELALVLLLPSLGFALAATTLVSRALGRGRRVAAQRWGWEAGRLGSAVVAVLALPVILAPATALAPFLRDPETLTLAIGPLRLAAAGAVAEAAARSWMASLEGAGSTLCVMIRSSSLRWTILVLLAWIVGPVLGGGLSAVASLLLLHGVVQAASFAWIWSRHTGA